jgi:capsid assembly protease
MNLSLLHRVLAQPWAVTPEHLALLGHLISNGQPERRALEILDEAEPPRCYVPLNAASMSTALAADLPTLPADTTVLMPWGILGRGWTEADRFWFDAVDTDDLTTAIEAADTGTIVLWFRSPGGIVTGIPEAAQAIRAAGGKKRILAFTDTLMASAAYWLAAQAQEIHATPTADVGSIGVYTAFYDFSEMLEREGIKLELFKAGRLKATGLMGNPLDEEARAHIQAAVDEAYAAFTSAVTRNRDIAADTMQGQTFKGKEAIARNLTDKNWPSAARFFASL